MRLRKGESLETIEWLVFDENSGCDDENEALVLLIFVVGVKG